MQWCFQLKQPRALGTESSHLGVAYIWIGFLISLQCGGTAQIIQRIPLFFPHFPHTFLHFISSLLLCQKISGANKQKVGIWGLNHTCLTTIPICFHNARAEMLSRKASSRWQFAGKATLFMTLPAWGAYSVPLSEKWFSSLQLAFLLAWQQQSVYLFEMEIFSAWCTCILHCI